MITDVGSYSETEFRMSDVELIRFYKLFSQAELQMLINVLSWSSVQDYFKDEVMIAEKVLETEELDNKHNFGYINITKKADLLTDKELKFLHTAAEDVNLFISYLNSENMIDETFGYEYGEIAEKLEHDVTDEIEERISTGKFIEVPPVIKTKVIKP